MSLRSQAHEDLKTILSDTAQGFGWEITVVSPQGEEVDLSGYSNDISQLIDPDTGQAVSGRRASVALAMQDLKDADLSLPKGVADGAKSPWLVRFKDVGGDSYTLKVVQTNPDRTLGLITCLLEAWK